MINRFEAAFLAAGALGGCDADDDVVPEPTPAPIHVSGASLTQMTLDGLREAGVAYRTVSTQQFRDGVGDPDGVHCANGMAEFCEPTADVIIASSPESGPDQVFTIDSPNRGDSLTWAVWGNTLEELRQKQGPHVDPEEETLHLRERAIAWAKLNECYTPAGVTFGTIQCSSQMPEACVNQTVIRIKSVLADPPQPESYEEGCPQIPESFEHFGFTE